jgi:poly(A) polymerase
LDNHTGKRPLTLLEHPRFRMGYDFLLLRVASGEAPEETGTWWEKFQHADPAERQRMLVPEVGGTKKRRRRRRKAPGEAPAAGVEDRSHET